MSVLPVTNIITTYDTGDNSRFNLLYQTIQGLLDYQQYDNLYWIITDDGSPNYAEMVEKVTQQIKRDDILFFNTQRKGVGFAKNNALRKAFEKSHIVFLLEDDWKLIKPLPMLRYVQQMLDHPDIGIVRFGYIGGSTLEAYYRGYSPFDTYWEMKQGTDVYCYSGQVSLRSKIWYDTVGWHDENCSAAEEELGMCLRANGTPNAPKILWPAEYGTTLNAGLFHNIGLGNSIGQVKPDAS